jgi:hypothetical protein
VRTSPPSSTISRAGVFSVSVGDSFIVRNHRRSAGRGE